HSVFAVQDRSCLISNLWKDELYKYIAGIIKNNGHKPLAINGMQDHIHIFIGMKPVQSLSDLMQDVKAYSSGWINDKKLVKGKFSWQSGYGGFSYSHSQIDKVIKYILKQEGHHKKKTFKEEYLNLLKFFNIEYDEKFLFKWIE
ncbi:MAG: IS200/IS605 family transposase, partial [Ignavibacteria bacterium]|nr:IS200/IS605 family transposase [Ignavibacteria bacterium]